MGPRSDETEIAKSNDDKRSGSNDPLLLLISTYYSPGLRLNPILSLYRDALPTETMQARRIHTVKLNNYLQLGIDNGHAN